ncbi:MAG: putative inorganic carbon transporter subunit DabA [Vicinamibacterales bacterium]
MTSTAVPRARLEHLVDHLAHLLPAQGPIGVFIHHNTLHAFQHLPFDRAVVDAARVFDAEPYLREEAYREALTRGRIHRDDLDAVLAAEGRDLEIRRAMLDPGARRFAPATIHWTLREERCRTEWRGDLPDPSSSA